MRSHYKVLVHYPKAQVTDSIITHSHGIRYAIEDIATMIRKQYSSMIEGSEYEIISVEKVEKIDEKK